MQNKSNNNKIKRRFQGVVVSDKMNKTRVVAVTRLKKHSQYLKYYKIIKKFKAHDENNEYKKEDRVIIEETKPISRDKRWKILKRI